jgi:hypothetical protein
MRSTHDIVQDHLAKRAAGDLEGDIRDNYSPDIVILSGDGALVGADGVRKSEQALSDALGHSTYDYEEVREFESYGFLEWSAKGERSTIGDGADSFVVRDDRIVFQGIHYTANPR